MKKLGMISLAVMTTACGGSETTSGRITSVSPPPPPVVGTTNTLTFSNVTGAMGLSHKSEFSSAYDEMPRHFAGGAAAGDVDNDGDIDLFIVRGDTQRNLLYINNGNGFTEAPSATNLALPNEGANYKLSGPTFADIDGDGDLDLFVGGLQGDPSLVFRNNSNGTFTDVTAGSGFDLMTSKNTISAAFGDYDQDGDLDVAMAHWGTSRDRLNRGETETLWRNESTASQIKFVAVSQESGIADELALDLNDGVLGVNHDYTFAPNFSDINGDGYPDLLSVADFKGSQVFINNQDGTFSNVTDRSQINDSNGMGTAVGDYDNDGDMDWFVSSIDGNRLYENIDGTLINVSDTAGIGPGSWGWGSCFADFDADGHLDIYQTNGWVSNNGGNPNAPYTSDRSRLWMADGRKGFSNQADEMGVADMAQGRAVVCADFDNDRDIDILLLTSNSDDGAIYWRNDLQTKNTIKVNLNAQTLNTQAIGAKIKVRSGNVTQLREVSIGSNFASHNPTEQIFGLGESDRVEDITIQWPNGTQTQQMNVRANQDLIYTSPTD